MKIALTFYFYLAEWKNNSLSFFRSEAVYAILESVCPLLSNFFVLKLLFKKDSQLSLASFQTAFAFFSFFLFLMDADILPKPWNSAISFSSYFLLVKSLCGLEASQVPAVEALSGAGEPCDIIDSSDEIDAQEESIHERTVCRKKKSKRHKGTGPAVFWIINPICGNNLKSSFFQ